MEFETSKQLKGGACSTCVSCGLIPRKYRGLIQRAKRFLVLRNFDSTVKICIKGLQMLLDDREDTSRTFDSSDRRDRCTCSCVEFTKTALGLLAIQALAELGKSQEGIPFALEWFGDIRDFPPEILQICICLQLNVKELESALQLAEVWLEGNLNHSSQDKYGNVSELYIKYILLPLGKVEKAQSFLVNSAVISEERKQKILLCMKSRYGVASDQSEDSKNEMISNDTICISQASENNGDQRKSPGSHHGVLSRVLNLLKLLKMMCTRKPTIIHAIKSVTRIGILLCFLYILIVKADFPVIFSRGSGQSVLWQAVTQAWCAFFAPYHLMPSG